MELIVMFLIVVLFYIYLKDKGNKPPSKQQQNGYSNTSPKSSYALKEDSSAGKVLKFLPPIPKDYQIYAEDLVSGVTFRKAHALQFANGSQQELLLERDSNNQHDKNAIKVIGITGNRKYFIGFVPKNIAKHIVATDMYDLVKPRLNRIYKGSKEYLEIHFQILGPKANKKQFDDFLNNKPADSSQKEFYKYFNIAIPKGLTTLQASKFINEYTNKLIIEEPKKIKDFDNLIEILEEFDDSDFRSEYEIKKPKNELIIDAVNQLLKQGHTYESLTVDIDEVVDKIKELQPDLDKS